MMTWLGYISIIIFIVALIYFGNVEEIEKGDRSKHRQNTIDYEDLCQ